jgi:type I restriction enzyme S subunit
MELRPGYKQTEVGVIPEEWDVDCLGDKTTKVGSGITPTGGEKVYKQEGRPFLRSQNVGWGTLLMEDIAFIDEATHETFKATEIEADDVFLNITGASIGRSAVADARVERGNVNQHVCIIRTSQNQLHPRFLNYFLLSEAGQRQIDSFQAGGNRQGLNFGQIRSFRLPVPPLPEQRAIAGALGDVDALLGALTRLIAKKRDLKQAAMQQLLTPPAPGLAGQTRLPGFGKPGGKWKPTSIGAIPQDWNAGPLQSVTLKIQDGTHFSPTTGGSDFLYVTSRNIGFGCLDVSDAERIDATQHRQIHGRCDVRKGDVLLTKDGANTGNAALNTLDEQFSLLSSVAFLRFDSMKFCPAFFLHQLLSTGGQQRIKGLMSGNAITRLTLQKIRALWVAFPSLPEQTAIAAVLSDMDGELATLEQRRDKTRALKQGMMQELLTGRIRLV